MSLEINSIELSDSTKAAVSAELSDSTKTDSTKTESAVSAEDECLICFLTINSDTFEITQTFCNHLFCKSCLQRWIAINASCPICRKELKEKNYWDYYTNKCRKEQLKSNLTDSELPRDPRVSREDRNDIFAEYFQDISRIVEPFFRTNQMTGALRTNQMTSFGSERVERVERVERITNIINQHIIYNNINITNNINNYADNDINHRFNNINNYARRIHIYN
jgi:hypothetical protein